MPSNKKKSATSRLPRAERAVRSPKSKTGRISRSLSERRQSSSAKKLGTVQRRRSVAAQSGSRLSAVQNKKSHAKAPRAEVKRPSLNLRTDVYNLKGKVVGKVQLPKEIFGAEINNKLMAQAVRVYRANQRLGTAKTKTRGEVKGSTRKIYRQKGTGRARHGSIRAPIFVHGGRAFGPKPRDFSLTFPQKMKRVSLFSALSSKLRDNEIKVLTGLEKIEPKTKKAYEVVKNLSGEDAKILLVTPNVKNIENIYRSFRNIKDLEIMNANLLNTYQVIDNKLIFLMRDAISSIKDNFLKKI